MLVFAVIAALLVSACGVTRGNEAQGLHRLRMMVPNSPGTVDEDYRGEVQVVLVNHGSEPFMVTRGMRIAQLIVAQRERANMVETAQTMPTVRGVGGFGSTGLAGGHPPKVG